MSTLPWETRKVKPLALPWNAPTRPELVKDPVTGLWPGQQIKDDIPDFLKRKVLHGTVDKPS